MIKIFTTLILCPVKWVVEFILKLIAIAAILICLVFLAGNFWIPTVLEGVLTNMSGFKTSVGKSRGSIFRGRFDLKDLKMQNPDSLFQSKDFVSINNIVTDVNVWSLWKDTIVVEEIVLDIDDLTMVTSGEGESNYTILVKNFKQGNQTAKKEASKKVDTGKHSPKKSVLIKSLTLSISTVHVIDEHKNSSREYKIDYRKEFHNVSDFAKIERQLISDLGKFGISIVIDSIISSIPMVPAAATDGIIKIKDISLDTAGKTKDLAGKIGTNLSDGIKHLIKKDK
ncbi:MAG: AsmA family protein [Puniceicoccales bacterium]|jgi:uncharacterized protein involved in outer membrane biogenesis|nr:AsmA family protein [Puniceicoccales bacterium]